MISHELSSSSSSSLEASTIFPKFVEDFSLGKRLIHVPFPSPRPLAILGVLAKTGLVGLASSSFVELDNSGFAMLAQLSDATWHFKVSSSFFVFHQQEDLFHGSCSLSKRVATRSATMFVRVPKPLFSHVVPRKDTYSNSCLYQQQSGC